MNVSTFFSNIYCGTGKMTKMAGKKTENHSRYLAKVAILVAIGATLHSLETFLPPPALPGAKLGLANLATILALSGINYQAGLTVAALRVFLGSLLSGTIFGYTFYLSLAGACTSALVMGFLLLFLLQHKSRAMFFLLGVSGAASHNLGQLAVAYLLVGKAVLVYLPYLLLFALFTGLFTGGLAGALQQRLEKIL
ncbi:Gx transporter family protein [Moorella sulfitireducens (nom. illeg.)]|uniref:Gx transporter family protein n=1 Tax=Neomoorella sulfitireducens TaxID=2972948 RepID=UPI0021AC1D32